METVTMFKARDGAVFPDFYGAEQHEKKLDAIGGIQSILKPVPKRNFSNGEGFVQQDYAALLEYKRQILRVMAEKDSKWQEFVDNPEKVHRQSIVGRVLSDSDQLLYGAWYRVMCIDDKCREWGQPYFANHPEEGEQRERTAND